MRSARSSLRSSSFAALWICRSRGLPWLVLVLLAVACATVPITGRSQFMLVSDDDIVRASADRYATFVAAAEQHQAILDSSESPEAAAALSIVKGTNRVHR